MFVLSAFEGYLLFFSFSAFIIILVRLFVPHLKDKDEYLVAKREVSSLRAALSIAVSWIWAPAIFVCSMQAYLKGLAGIFWFTLPNIICFFIFIPFALQLRKLFPFGYTLAEYVGYRFKKNPEVHLSYLVVFLGYQISAIVCNTLAGGLLIHALSGVDISKAILLIGSVSLAYTISGGFKASIFTDVIQMLMVLLIVFIIVPWCFVGSLEEVNIVNVLGGLDGKHLNIIEPSTLLYLAIPMTLTLISGPLADQMFFQRALAVKSKDIVKVFSYGALFFSFVPILLSLLGFIGIGLVEKNLIKVADNQLVGAYVVSYLLPRWALYGFCFMAFGGLCSTLDSSLCAISSIGSIDIYKKYINPEASDNKILFAARFSMLFFFLIGITISLMQPKLLWVFLIGGALASSALVPTFFVLFTKNISAQAIFKSLAYSLLITLPLSIYANVQEDQNLILLSSLSGVVIPIIVIGYDVIKSSFTFDQSSLNIETCPQNQTLNI